MSAEPTSPPVEPDAPGGVYVTGLRVVLTGRETRGLDEQLAGVYRLVELAEDAFDDLDVFNQMMAVLETAAHLDVLVLQDELGAERVEGVLHYS